MTATNIEWLEIKSKELEGRIIALTNRVIQLEQQIKNNNPLWTSLKSMRRIKQNEY